MFEMTGYPTLIASRSAYLDAVMVDEYTKTQRLWPSIFNRKTIDSWSSIEAEMAGFGFMGQLSSGWSTERPQVWPEQQLTPMWTKTWSTSWYGTKVVFTLPFTMNDKDGLQTIASGRELVSSAENTVEYWGVDVFNKISDSTAYTVPDSSAKAIASTTHNLMDNILGGATTYSNYMATTPDNDTLWSAYYQMQMMPNARGIFLDYEPSRIVCHPALMQTMSEILYSPLRSDTSENTHNVVGKDFSVTLIPWKWLSSSTHWTVLAAKHYLYYVERMPLRRKVWTDDTDESIHAKLHNMFSFGAGNWRGVVSGNI
jgi:hypothetical protein